MPPPPFVSEWQPFDYLSLFPASDVPIRLNTKFSGKHVFLINLDGYDVEKIRRRCENSHPILLKIHSESVVA